MVLVEPEVRVATKAALSRKFVGRPRENVSVINRTDDVSLGRVLARGRKESSVIMEGLRGERPFCLNGAHRGRPPSDVEMSKRTPNFVSAPKVVFIIVSYDQ